MYQVTAIYEGSEIGYAEADGFEYAKEEVMDQLMNGFYAEVAEDVILHCRAPSGMFVEMPVVI